MILGGFISLLVYIDQSVLKHYIKKTFSGYTFHKALNVLDSQHKNYSNFVKCNWESGTVRKLYKTRADTFSNFEVRFLCSLLHSC